MISFQRENLGRRFGQKFAWVMALILAAVFYSPKALAIMLAYQPPVNEAGDPQGGGPPGFSPGVAEIVKMVDAKVDPGVIKAYVKNSGVAYNPSADEIVALKQRGADNEVLTAILQRGGELRAQAAASGTPLPPQGQYQPPNAAPAYSASEPPYPYVYPAYYDYGYNWYPYYYPYYVDYVPSWYYPFGYWCGFGWPFICSPFFSFAFCFDPFCHHFHHFHHDGFHHFGHDGFNRFGGGIQAIGPNRSGTIGTQTGLNRPGTMGTQAGRSGAMGNQVVANRQFNSSSPMNLRSGTSGRSLARSPGSQGFANRQFNSVGTMNSRSGTISRSWSGTSFGSRQFNSAGAMNFHPSMAGRSFAYAGSRSMGGGFSGGRSFGGGGFRGGGGGGFRGGGGGGSHGGGHR